ncbi:MAG: RhuM family protein [Allosphingosinicella sp.]
MKETEPVHLQEDADTGDRFLIYGSESGVRVEVHYQGDELWMTQAQIARLYGRDVSVISRHINKIIRDGEVGEGTYLHDMQISTAGRPVTLYGLDMVIGVGFKVSSPQAALFRRWATDKLVQFATKGFVIDTRRLKNPEMADRVTELRDIIRDIRSDEANVYRELRRICAMCQDYNGTSEVWHSFYRNTQAKLVYAVTSQTPAAILQSRADSRMPRMGLTTWAHDNIRKSDVCVSKNYLGDAEIRELNRLTVILLDIFDDQLDIGKLTTMAEAEQLLDRQLRQLNRVVLSHGGSVAMADARRHAEREYGKFKALEKARRHAEADKAIQEIKAAQKGLPKTRRAS